MRHLLLAVLLSGPALAARAGEIVVVAPGNAAEPYREALDGICAALGACPQVFAAEKKFVLPEATAVVVALGGRAARRRYPASVTVVSALSPGYDAAGIRVPLTYSPADFARRFLALKPGARRLVVLCLNSGSRSYAQSVKVELSRSGVEVLVAAASSPDDAPALLRSLPPSDAVWLAPDSELVTPTIFDEVREYARSRGASFFAPAPGLAARGAEPGLAPGFRAAGWRAGLSARDALASAPTPVVAFPDEEPSSLVSGLTVSTKTSVAPIR